MKRILINLVLLSLFSCSPNKRSENELKIDFSNYEEEQFYCKPDALRHQIDSVQYIVNEK